MNKADFLNLPHLPTFIDWIISKEEPNSLTHNYVSLQPQRKWSCHSLYNAFENYDWRGSDFKTTSVYLENLKVSLRNAMADGQSARQYCEHMLRWGGVLNKGNIAKLDIPEPFQTLEGRLLDARTRLDPGIFNTTHSIDNLFMSSGFSKIYSLIIDDFIIYDSRVGAALGLLVRKYCEESGLKTIPIGLTFAYAKARATNGHVGEIRDPSSKDLVFPRLNNNTKRYIENNMRANWLIETITKHEKSRFSLHQTPGRCLESALFMIGYKVN